MLPGQFPSPTPSREMSPVQPSWFLLDTPDAGPQARARSRICSANFTAANHLRARPRFAGAQDDAATGRSVLSDLASSDRSTALTSPSSRVYRPAAERRHVSDPLHSQARKIVRQEPNSSPTPRQKRQRLLGGPQYGDRTTAQLQSSGSSQLPSTPLTHAHSLSEKPTPIEGHPLASPETEDKQSAIQEAKRALSPATPKTARATHEKLRSKLQEDLTFSDAKGVIYVLRDLNRPELGYKIGSTTRANYEDRVDEHQRNCKLEVDVVYVSHELEYCCRTEKLIQIDLADRCRRWQCDKHRAVNGVPKISTHEEWFDVTEALAIQSVKRWESFMLQEKPYDWRRKLKPVWRHLLETRRITVPNAGTLTHETRREHWNLILAPPATSDYIATYRKILSRVLRRLSATTVYTRRYLEAFFWQLTALVYGMVTLLVCRNIVAFTAFALVVICAGVSVFPYLKLTPPKKRLRRLS